MSSQPIDTAFVEIRPDTGSFIPQLQRDLNAAFNRIERTVAESLGGVSRQFERTGESAESTFRETARAADKQYEKIERSAKENTSRVTGHFGGMVRGIVAGFAGLGVVRFGQSAVTEASNLNESLNAVQVMLGGAGDSFIEFGKNAADTLGLTQAELNQAVTPMASLFANAGLKGEGLSKNLQSLAQRAVDVGSVFNTTTEDVLGAFGAALRGESEPVRRFGVTLNEAAIGAEAVRLGLADSAKNVSESAKVQARYSLLLQQTSKTQGDFANTSTGVANASRIANAQWKEAQARLGTVLLPIVSKGAALFGNFSSMIMERVVPAIQGLIALIVKGDYTGGLGKALGIEEDSPIVSIVLTIRDTVLGMFNRIADAAAGMTGGGAGGGIWAWLGGAAALVVPLLAHFGKFAPLLAKLAPMFRTVFSFLTGPLGIVISLFTLAYASSEEFRIAINDLFTVIGALVGTLAQQLMPIFTQLAKAILPILVTLVVQVADTFGTLLQALMPVIQQLISALVPVIVLLVQSIMPPLLAIFNALIPIFLQLVRSVVPPLIDIFKMIAPVIKQLMPVITDLIKIIADMLMPIIRALLPVVKVVFETIARVIRAAMDIIRGIIMVVTGLIRGDWSRVWEGIKAIFSGVWDAIKAIVTGAINIVKSVISAGFNIVKTIIGGIWEGIKRLLKAGWDWISKYVFTPLKNGVQGLGKIFEGAVKVIGTAWDKVKSVASKPVDFVVNTVVGKWIVGGYNWLADKVGLPIWKFTPIKFAKGGVNSVLPGYTPGRDVHRFYSATGGVLDMSGGESIMRPEFTRKMGGPKGIAALNKWARDRSLPFAQGGVFPHQSFASGGLFGWLGNIASNVVDWGKSTWDFLSNPGEALRGLFGKVVERFGNSPAVKMLGGVLNKGISGVVEKFKGLFGGLWSGRTLVQAGRVMSGGHWLDTLTYAALQRARRTSGIAMRIIQGSWSFNPLSKGTHAGAGAVDLTVAAGKWWDAVDALRRERLLAMFRDWAGNQHIHAINPNVKGLSDAAEGQVERALRNRGLFARGGVYDRGGWLPPGASIAYNGTGQSEWVGGPASMVINLNVSIDDLAKMSKLTDFLKMLEDARVAARRTTRSGTVSA
jgi:phage-related protein